MTLSDVGFQNFRSSIVKAIWVIGALGVMYVFDWHELLKGKVGEIWAGILALAGVVILIFLINLISMPAKMQEEAEREIERLKKMLFDRDQRQKEIDELWKLRSEGIDFRNNDANTVKTEEDWNQWQSQYHNWRVKILAKANDVNPNLRHWLEHLDQTTPNPGDLRFDRQQHELLARITSTMLSRLQKFLEREMLRAWDTENT